MWIGPATWSTHESTTSTTEANARVTRLRMKKKKVAHSLNALKKKKKKFYCIRVEPARVCGGFLSTRFVWENDGRHARGCWRDDALVRPAYICLKQKVLYTLIYVIFLCFCEGCLMLERGSMSCFSWLLSVCVCMFVDWCLIDVGSYRGSPTLKTW